MPKINTFNYLHRMIFYKNRSVLLNADAHAMRSGSAHVKGIGYMRARPYEALVGVSPTSTNYNVCMSIMLHDSLADITM